MNFFEKIVYFLDGKMVEPTNYGIFHIVSFLLVILLTVLVCVCFKNCKDKTFRRITLICWLVMLVLEVYKHLVFAFEYTPNGVVWDYEWYAFPLQLCSSPLYILPFVVFLKDGKLRDAMMCYIGTFSLFGGLVVMFYPNDVFVDTIGVNFQTMIHHGIQVILGVFFMVYNRHKLTKKLFLNSIFVFAVFATVVVLSNFIMPSLINEKFNMMYLSPYYGNTIPVIGDIYNALPYPVYLLLFLGGAVLASYILYIIQYAIVKKSCNS